MHHAVAGVDIGLDDRRGEGSTRSAARAVILVTLFILIVVFVLNPNAHRETGRPAILYFKGPDGQLTG